MPSRRAFSFSKLSSLPGGKRKPLVLTAAFGGEKKKGFPARGAERPLGCGYWVSTRPRKAKATQLPTKSVDAATTATASKDASAATKAFSRAKPTHDSF